MATKSEQKFVVKKVKAGRGENAKSFYMEVGRLTIRETDKGISGTLYLHHLDGDFTRGPLELPRGGLPRRGRALGERGRVGGLPRVRGADRGGRP